MTVYLTGRWKIFMSVLWYSLFVRLHATHRNCTLIPTVCCIKHLAAVRRLIYQVQSEVIKACTGSCTNEHVSHIYHMFAYWGTELTITIHAYRYTLHSSYGHTALLQFRKLTFWCDWQWLLLSFQGWNSRYERESQLYLLFQTWRLGVVSLYSCRNGGEHYKQNYNDYLIILKCCKCVCWNDLRVDFKKIRMLNEASEFHRSPGSLKPCIR